MSFLKSYCFLLAPLSKWCFYSYLAFHCQANFPRCLFFHTLPCSKATSGSLLCLIPIPPHSGFPTINVVHSAPSLSLFHKQRRKNSHGLPSLRGTRMIKNHASENRRRNWDHVPTLVPLFTDLPLRMWSTFIRLHRQWVWKQEVWRQKGHVFSNFLPKVSYQIYKFAKHKPYQV